MTMTITQQIITVAVVVLGTMTTRFLPFLIFPEGKEPPAVITYLGTVLPYAVIGLLVVYCLKDVPGSGHYGIPELIAILFIVALHKWKKSTLLSMAAVRCFIWYWCRRYSGDRNTQKIIMMIRHEVMYGEYVIACLFLFCGWGLACIRRSASKS